MKQLGILGLMPEVEIQKRIEEQARTIFNLNLAREKRTLLITKPDLAADEGVQKSVSPCGEPANAIRLLAVKSVRRVDAHF